MPVPFFSFEVREAAKAKTNGTVVEGINKSVSEEVTWPDPKTGNDVVVVKTTDMDLVAGGVLWQVKVGPESLTNLDSFRVWMKVAVAHAQKTGRKVGLMLDPLAKATFNGSPTCQRLWKEAKTVLGEARVTIEIIDPP